MTLSSTPLLLHMTIEGNIVALSGSPFKHSSNRSSQVTIRIMKMLVLRISLDAVRIQKMMARYLRSPAFIQLHACAKESMQCSSIPSNLLLLLLWTHKEQYSLMALCL
jgi:hypothetical protein